MSTTPRMTGKSFKERLAALAVQLEETIQARVEAFPADPAASRARRRQAQDSFRTFAHTYFPHYVSPHDSRLHSWLYQRLPQLADQPGGAKLAVAAPRGEAKSTLATQLFTLWCALTGRKRFIPIIMDAQTQAVVMLAAIKAELENNPRLKRDFPEGCGKGRTWQEARIITAGNVRIQAFGSGERMRGLRHGPHRPDLVICDDLENDENVRSAEQRDKLEAWFTQAVLRLGPPDDSLDVVVVGTILHHDSLLARLLENPLWESRRFQAIIAWPDRMDLWARWEERLRNEGEAAADAYHARHRERMEAGAEVSWPAVRPLLTLMKIRARDGHDAFDAELQNTPLAVNATFSQVHFWVREGHDWLFYGAVDPSLGRSGGRGDPSAVLVGGYDRASGVLHVVEADIRRRLPDRLIEDVIAFQAQYDCRLWVVESIQFQEFFKDELIRRSAKRGVPVPARGIKPSGDKGLRIQSLQPHLANGLIRLKEEQRELLRQLRHWGEGGVHDDGPDALHMLWQAASGARAGVAGFHSIGRRQLAAEPGFTGGGFGGVAGNLRWEGY